jgi:hypothetical protein
MHQGQMLRSFGNFSRIARQGQNDARSQNEGLVRMADVESPAIGCEDSEGYERPSPQQVEKVLRTHDVMGYS